MNVIERFKITVAIIKLSLTDKFTNAAVVAPSQTIRIRFQELVSGKIDVFWRSRFAYNVVLRMTSILDSILGPIIGYTI